MTTNSLFRSLALAGAALLVITFAQGTVSADQVVVAGSTLGCFGTGCTPAATATSPLGLTFSNSTFVIATTGGFGTLNSLGSLTMSSTPGDLDNQTFTLQITFTAPEGFTGPNQVTIVYTISTGFTMIGGVLFEPDPFFVPFSFSDSNCEPDPTGGITGEQTTCGTGSFRFSLHDVALDPGQTVAIRGAISNAQQQIPDPTTMLLMGTGLAGVAVKTRRKLLRAAARR